MGLQHDENNMANFRKLKEAGFAIPYRFPDVISVHNIQERYGGLAAGQNTQDSYCVAGVVHLARSHGKLTFLDIYDGTDKIQILANSDSMGQQYDAVKHIESGDVIGIKGNIMKTRRGELSVLANNLTLLSKSLLPVPVIKGSDELTAEKRYRQRYLEWKTNPESRQIIYKRSKTIDSMRRFLTDQGFIEVDIPILQPVYGGASAKPFTTDVNALSEKWYLSISPELYLKRYIIGGFPRVFAIVKNFRNEGIDKTHNPEFTMMESYDAYHDLYDVMEMTENMIAYIAEQVTGSTKVRFQGTDMEFKPPWKRMTMEEAVFDYAGIDVPEDYDKLVRIAEEYGLNISRINRPNIIGALFDKFAEKHPIQPTFIHDYPKDISPLTRDHREKPGWVERFEGYLNGVELANAYSELVDPFEQMARFKQQEKERSEGDEEAHPTDGDFVRALMYGMPPTGGLGVGVDRLVMYLTDSPTIKDVIPFPMVKKEIVDI